jgi:hypothetical protein
MLVQYMERGPGAGPGDEAGAWPLPGRTRIRSLEQGLHRAERVGSVKNVGNHILLSVWQVTFTK